MKKFRWCFIGAGGLARQVASQLKKSGRHEVVAVYTRDYGKCVEFADKYGCKPYKNVEDAITSPDVDGVYIVTPHNAHYRYAKMSLLSGKPVFCEKAFTVTADEADELIKLSREKGVYLCEAMWTWFSPCANMTKKWIDENKIGKVKSAYFSYHVNIARHGGRLTDPKRAGGALLDITVYPITYAYRLFGFPDKIECKAKMKDGVDLSEEITFTYNDGLRVYITSSLEDSKGLEKMVIEGENGVIKAPFFHAYNKITCKKSLFNRETFRGDGPRINSYLDEFDAVADDIINGRTESSFVPLTATSDVMHIMDSIREQIGLKYDNLE